MDIPERYQGSSSAEDGVQSNAMDRILQRSRDRLSDKRQRDTAALPPDQQPKTKQAKLAPRGKIINFSTAIAGKEYLLTETPEEKKARKLAMKQARRTAKPEKDQNVDGTDGNGGSNNTSIEPIVASAQSTSSSKPKKVKHAVEKEAVEENIVRTDMSISIDEENGAKNYFETAFVPIEASSTSISQQLFPKGSGTSKSDAEAAKKGIEVEDVIESAYVTADMTRLPLEDAIAAWNLNQKIVDRLREETDVTEFFPVQTAVIPVLLRMNALECICPRDVCVAAPTGSGKTLAYSLPIIQTLLRRRVTRLRAVILLPSRELVTQVYNVFKQITKNTDIKVGMATGHTYFPDEQNFLSPEHSRSSRQSSLSESNYFINSNAGVDMNDSKLGSSSVDVLICTPGRLVDHIQFTKGFTLDHLRYLVLDEADRLLGNASDHWIRTLVRSIGSRSRMSNGIKIDKKSSVTSSQGGIQLLLFSATFTDNPRKLAMLGIHSPLVIRVNAELISEPAGSENDALAANLFEQNLSDNEDEELEEASKKRLQREDVDQTTMTKVFNLPLKLREMICVGDAADKPLQLAALLHDRRSRDGKMALVFASSVETTHRLCRLLQLINGQCGGDDSPKELLFGGLVREMSSLISSCDRERVMVEATSGKVKVLISSDHLARGIDLATIDIVINYDPPKYAKTYVHRVGRTARAGRAGESVTMLKLGQIGSFNKMRQSIGGGAVSSNHIVNKGVVCDKYHPNVDIMSFLKPIYGKAIRRTQAVLAEEQSGALLPSEEISVAKA